ncbi:MAG: nuclear transport factor 2 family protein [Sandaracinaceae bacterium]|nr:nuclear transport factor 2 family protein [Sandaracinaceae bacterium]
MDDTLLRRIERLEDIEDIKKLKAHYWYSCDQKNVEAVRDCFVEGEVLIDYDGPVGLVRHRDELYAVFEKVGCQPNIVEIHHGGPPQIELLGDGRARGIWGLTYNLLDTNAQVLNVIGGYYTDEYVKTADGWRIQQAVFRVVSATTVGYKDRALKALHMGSGLPKAG